MPLTIVRRQRRLRWTQVSAILASLFMALVQIGTATNASVFKKRAGSHELRPITFVCYLLISYEFTSGDNTPINDEKYAYFRQYEDPNEHGESITGNLDDWEEDDSEDEEGSEDTEDDEDYDEDEDEDENQKDENSLQPEILDMTDAEILEHTMPLPERELLKQSYYTAKDKLFSRIEWIENLRHPEMGISGASFGELLNAGTGPHSLKWIASIAHREKILARLRQDEIEEDEYDEENFSLKGRVCTTSDYNSDDPEAYVECISNVAITNFTAVTAADGMRKTTLHSAARLSIANSTNSPGEIIIGNWDNVDFLLGRKFDTILADYLIGAIDGFSPYFQDLVFERLLQHLKPGGRIYVVGLTPIPDLLDGPENVFCKITRVRDACIKLAGDRCYREYPMNWIVRHLKRSGLQVIDTFSLPIRYTAELMTVQINVCRRKLGNFPTKGLSDEMSALLNKLEEEARIATEDGPLLIGTDYVVSAELPFELDDDELDDDEEQIDYKTALLEEL
mmetsp:Transcript_25734/g.53063  ORF Transcript_25734/g.53063 Transcript_25734/m.53063 type:complete len:509 (-) Transcript_25734:179-1705(-)